MAANKKFLKSNVMIEPLVFNWYAWTHLLSPLTASALLKNRYIPILNSFLQHPELHHKVFLEKKLSAGPYVNLAPTKTGDIQLLLDQLLSQNKNTLTLMDDFKYLNNMLIKDTEGFSLESIYSQIPSGLKGCVELVYDLNHKANIRLFENLLYKKYFNLQSQSVYLSSSIVNYRPYILSTPRLNNETSCQLPISFSSACLTELISQREQCGNVEDLINLAIDSNVDLSVVSNFFTDQPPIAKTNKNYLGEEVRVRYFGHACVLIQTNQVSILIDPLINYETSEEVTYTYADLPDIIDYVVITHAHQDHCSLETLLQIKHKIGKIVVPASNHGFLADPSLKLALAACGFSNVIETNNFDEVQFSNGVIMAIPFLGEHGDLDIRSKTAYYIQIKNKSFLFAADSNNLDPNLYENLQQYLGKIDYLFIGMECVGAPYSWTYDHLLINKPTRQADQSRRLNGSDSSKVIDMIRCLSPQSVIIYAMGMEPHLHYILGLAFNEESAQLREANKVIDYCKINKIKSFQPYLKHEWSW